MHKNTSNITITNPVVLFDGVCNLCNSTVQFLLIYNKNKNLHFASLQSSFAKQLLAQRKYSADDMSTIVFIENEKIYTKSSAAFQVTKYLVYPWKTFFHFRHLPTFFTDWIYDVIAKNRYVWFGKRENCMIPKPEWENRFYN